MNSSPILKSFSRRVRLVRAWVGLSIGLSVGALLAVVWAGLDWANILYAEWSSLGWLVGSCGLIGLLVGAFRGVSATALADSIDRRARLENRLSTAAERSSTSGAFDDALRQDATDHLKGLKPAKLYPIRLGKWHAGAALFSILAASIFLLGNTPLLLGKDAKATRAKMQEQAAKIDHVLKPMEEEAKKGELNPAEKKLAEDLKKLSQDLKKARIDPEKALQRQNELNKEAQKLQDERFQKADQSMQTAQQAFDKMQKEKLEQRMDMDPKGMTGAEMEQAKLDLSKMSPQDLRKALDLERKINDIKQQLKDPNLSKEAQDALKHKLDELSKMLANMHLSPAVQKMFDRMMQDPLWKEIQDAMMELQKKKEELQKLLDTSKKMGKQNQPGQPELTKEQQEAIRKAIEQQMKELEQMAKDLSSDKAMHEYLERLLQALKNGRMGGQGMGLGLGIGLGMGLPQQGAGAPSRDLFFANTGKIFKGKGEKSRGTTEMSTIRGQSRDVPGQNAYIEMRGPSTTGLRSSIPYQKVLPSYKHKADEAMNRQEIPPEHQKRVKKYFESLGQ